MTQVLPMLDYETASPEVRAAWDGEIAVRGRITNMKRTFLHSPESFKVMMEFYTVYERLVPVVGKRAVWLFCHAISSGNDCLICSMYFRRNLIDSGVNPSDYVPTEDEQLLIDFGRMFSHANPTHKPDPEIWPRIKARFDAVQIVDLTVFGGLMVANNIFNDFLEVPLDDALYDYMPDGAQG